MRSAERMGTGARILARKRRRAGGGFTLIELMVVVTLVGILSTMAAPSIFMAIQRANARRCGANLLLIETAKEGFGMEHPAEVLTSAVQLLPYLRSGLPTCPSGGAYEFVVERFVVAACTLNGGEGDLVGDGLHDPGL